MENLIIKRSGNRYCHKDDGLVLFRAMAAPQATLHSRNTKLTPGNKRCFQE
jgi:hypothetical protein